MSSCWVRRNAKLFPSDWDLLSFGTGRSEALVIRKDYRTSELIGNTLSVFDEGDLLEYSISNTGLDPEQHKTASQINLILCDKGGDLGDITFSKETFLHLQNAFFLHSSIIRGISRSTSCSFISFPYTWENTLQSSQISMVYNCRTPDTWADDMALTVTFLPQSLTTNATWFGCNLSKHDISGYDLSHSELIRGRLANFDGRLFHPMILPLLLADIERDRQVSLVRRSRRRLPQKLNELREANAGIWPRNQPSIHTSSVSERWEARPIGSWSTRMKQWWTSIIHASLVYAPTNTGKASVGTESPSDLPRGDILQKSCSSIQLWTDTAYVRDGLSAWTAQLTKMMEETMRTRDPVSAFGVQWEHEQINYWQEVSDRIRDRLRELLDEYEEHIRECTCIMDGLQLANQMELSAIGRGDAQTNLRIARVNLEVARLARQDGSIMKSIAVLGMIFLPATFLSSFFSLDFFEWSTMSGNYSPPIGLWIYIGSAIGLTVITCSTFYYFVLRQRQTALLDIERSLK